jgi:hypothetical protein
VQKSYSRKSFAISDVLHATSADAIPGRQLSQNIVSKDDHGQSAQKSNKKEKVWVLERSGSIHPRDLENASCPGMEGNNGEPCWHSYQ